MKKTLVILGVLFSLVSSAQQVAKGLTASNGEYIGFYEYKPADYNTNTKYPVIIFLHGIGERGNGTTELSRVLGPGIPGAIQNGHNMRFFWNGKWETFLVLSPQLNSKYGSWQNWYVEEMINYATRNLSIDPNRIFLTGLSLGGGGTWKYAAASLTNAKKLAAIGVCCGTCENVDFSNIAKANLPTWAWHAKDDGTVGAGCSSGSITAINNANPAVKPYLTLWETGQHWIWGRVYNTDYAAQHPNIFEWFLGQDKSKPVNKRPIANAGPDQTISALTGTATLNGSGSRDDDGKIVRYVWSKVSGPNYGTIASPVSTSATTTVSGLTAPGTYVFELRVIDDRADWTVDQVTITVSNQPGTDPVGNKPPVAKAGNDITITLPTNSATLDGSGSSDPDGSITSYSWSKVAGPSQFTLNNSTSAKATVTNLVEGTYTFRLTVKDNNNATATDDINVVVKSSTSSGGTIANAGSDITITLPTNSTTLNGSASKNPNGEIKAYEWTKVSGPSQYTIENAKAVTTKVSNLVAGTYEFKLTVWDHVWRPTSDIVKVVVNSSSSGGGSGGSSGSIANAGADFTVVLPNNGTLDGSASKDPGGAIKAFEWTKVSGPSQYTIANPKSVTTTISNLVAGTYTFKLTVWDHNWVPSSDLVTVTVTGSSSGGGGGSTGNGIANAGPDFTVVLPNNGTLDGSASKDPNGEIKAYEWTKVSGPSQYSIANSKAVKTTISNLVVGTYVFRLTVWGNNWVPKSDEVVVTVKSGTSGGGGGTVPGKIPNAGPDIYLTLPTNSTTLDGSASKNPDGEIKAYEWTKIAGPSQYSIASPKSVKTTVSNLVEGVYRFKLTVWDHTWRPNSDTVDVIVKGTGSGDGPDRWANAGPDIYITLPINSTTLDGSASADPSGGQLKAFEWKKVSGPSQYTITNPKAAKTTLTNLAQGNYVFELTVWNKDWVPAHDKVNVIVMSGTASSSVSMTTTNAIMSKDIAGAEPIAESKLSVYPNPAHGMINVQLVSEEQGKTMINIYDVSGKKVQTVNFEKTASLQQKALNVTQLTPGIYHVEVIINSKQKMITKFVKQ
jgi:pimeloyl-ACP methyl ester carboxylesterase